MKAYVVYNFTTKTMEGIASAAYTFKNEKPTIDEILDATEQIKNNRNYEQVVITSIIPVYDETADVMEKKNAIGYWARENLVYKCSCCNAYLSQQYPYCPWCGSKMYIPSVQIIKE